MLKNQYLALGLMSGTSLDGLDLALCHFHFKNEHWTFQVKHAETLAYPPQWVEKLCFAPTLSATGLLKLDHEYGIFLASQVNAFLQKHQRQPDFIASHGHTLYHKPSEGYTFQLGNGPEIFAGTALTTVCDFRRPDVALGGQGAPLVPIGDQLLFGDYDACLNLGGFANISFATKSQRIAFDICPVNFVLNRLAQELGMAYDKDGATAAFAEIDLDLLENLNQHDFYRQSPPKSLGAEWVEENIWPQLKTSSNTEQKLATATAHAAQQIAAVLNHYQLGTCLVTGGGAFNRFLMESIQKQTRCQLVVPDENTVNFKEALIFAFLGVLRLRGEINVLASVTGSRHDHSSGIIYDKRHPN